MTPMRWSMSLLILASLALSASSQGLKRRDAIVVYKDGFSVKGSVKEDVAKLIFDPETGRAFTIPSGNFHIDDDVRTIRFSPGNVASVRQLLASEVVESRPIVRIPSINQTTPLRPTWTLDGISEWTDKGERTVSFSTPEGAKTMRQKVGLMTPRFTWVCTLDGYKWNLMYATQEFEPKKAREILLQIFSEVKPLKDMKPPQKFLKVAGFMQEAGWFNEAERELVAITENYPDEKKAADEMLVKLRKDRADLFVETIDQARKVGQHELALERLDSYDSQDLQKIVSPAARDKGRSLKEDYDKEKTALAQARKHLKELPAHTKAKVKWTKALEFIGAELNLDTVDRLEEFLRQAAQFERQRKDKVELTHNAEQVLAFAVTSWLQGKEQSFKDPELALKLIRSRELLLQYLQPDNDVERPALLSGFQGDMKLPLDVMGRLVRLLPPPEAEDVKKLDTEMQTCKLASGETYLVQLPPDYHHQRAYPVLMAFHARDSAADTLKKLSAEAAKHGFILAAPLWAGNKLARAPTYKYSRKEHEIALDTLRDLRRRFQIDSDKVFLFGWEQGAYMALDVGLGHPDQFAGVVSMNGTIAPFASRWYWTNGQYLPFYVIEGQRNASHATTMSDLFKEKWTRAPFASLYVEYKGRASEWYSVEVANMFKWMSFKKRYLPLEELGKHDFRGTGLYEEFRSSRNIDNRFYWFSCEAIDVPRQWDHIGKMPIGNYQPATFQANISLGNELVKTTKKDKIWNRIQVRVSGAKQVTLWLTPDMIDFTKPLETFVNGQQQGGLRDPEQRLETLLEEVHRSGDRQRLYVAKIDLKT